MLKRSSLGILLYIVLFAVVFAAPNAVGAALRMSADDFLELCKSGKIQEIEAAVKAGADVNAKNNNGVTPLMKAVYYD